MKPVNLLTGPFRWLYYKISGKTPPTRDDMVWEALRLVPIRPDIFRKAASDYTIAKGTERETTIRKGTIVRLLTHSAMFDTYAYENPDEFSPGATISKASVKSATAMNCFPTGMGRFPRSSN